MRDRRSTIGGALPSARLRRIRSGFFGGGGGGGGARQDENTPSTSRRTTLVGALLRPRKSLGNLMGRRDTAAQAEPEVETEETEEQMELVAGPEYQHSVSTVQAVLDLQPRESVEGSSVYSRTIGGRSIYSDDQTGSDSSTIRAVSRDTERRMSSDTAASVSTAEWLPRRPLRRTSEFWRRSYGNLRNTAFMDSLRDVETPGQSAEDALDALNAGAGASEATLMGRSAGYGAREALYQGGHENAAAEKRPAAEEVAANKRRKLSALSMSDLLSKLTLRRPSRPAADEAISPRTAVPGTPGLDAHAEAVWRNRRDAELYHSSSGSTVGGPSTTRNDSAQQQAAYEARIAAKKAEPDTVSLASQECRSRALTIECEMAFRPDWQPIDGRIEERRFEVRRLLADQMPDDG